MRGEFDPFNPEEGGHYDIAQICLNGHVVNGAVQTTPEHNEKFCKKCGQPTIIECPHCKKEIPGYFIEPGIVAFGEISAPGFCTNCGQPYPWTVAKLNAARELSLEIEGLSHSEKEVLSLSLDDLIKDSPSTPLAAVRFKKLMVKAGKESAAALRDILVDIASETAKRSIWGP